MGGFQALNFLTCLRITSAKYTLHQTEVSIYCFLRTRWKSYGFQISFLQLLKFREKQLSASLSFGLVHYNPDGRGILKGIFLLTNAEAQPSITTSEREFLMEY